MSQKTSSARIAQAMEQSRRQWQRQAQPEVGSHLDMHADHRLWLSDHAMWRDEVAVWQKELNQAFENVNRLKEAIQSHQQAMQEHLKDLHAEEQAHAEHEQALVDFEKGGQGNRLLPMAKSHKNHASAHMKQQIAHERFKRYQHTLIAHVLLLVKAVREMDL